MSWKTLNQEKRLYLIAALVLLLGLASSIVVYLAAGDDPDTALGYTIVGGQAYPIMPEDSKMLQT